MAWCPNVFSDVSGAVNPTGSTESDILTLTSNADASAATGTLQVTQHDANGNQGCKGSYTVTVTKEQN
jgi:hypothetical protein